MLTNMSPEEWDAIMRVHLRGHSAPTRWAAPTGANSQGRREGPRAVMNTSSTSGLFGNIGQTNYGAAKTGIATFSIIADAELAAMESGSTPSRPPRRRALPTIPRERPGTSRRQSSGRPWTRQHLALRRLPVDRPCPIHGRVFFVQWRRGPPFPSRSHRRPHCEGRAVDGRGAPATRPLRRGL